MIGYIEATPGWADDPVMRHTGWLKIAREEEHE